MPQVEILCRADECHHNLGAEEQNDVTGWYRYASRFG